MQPHLTSAMRLKKDYWNILIRFPCHSLKKLTAIWILWLFAEIKAIYPFIFNQICIVLQQVKVRKTGAVVFWTCFLLDSFEMFLWNYLKYVWKIPEEGPRAPDRSYGRGRDLSGTEYQVCDDDDDYLNIVPMILGTTRRTSGSGSGEMLSWKEYFYLNIFSFCLKCKCKC